MTIRTTRLLVAFLVVSAVGAASLGAQPRNDAETRQDVEGMMEAYVLSKLQDALELSDEQFGAMVVAQKKLSDARREYRRSRMQVLRQIRQALQRDSTGEAELQPLLGQLDTIRDEFAATEKSRYAAIDEILDIRQRARYRILEIELQRRLGEMMRQVRGRGDQRRQPEFP